VIVFASQIVGLFGFADWEGFEEQVHFQINEKIKHK